MLVRVSLCKGWHAVRMGAFYLSPRQRLPINAEGRALMRFANTWFQTLVGWLHEYSFAPRWLPKILRSQRVGTAIAVIAGAIATLFGKALQAHDPTFPYPQVAYALVDIGVAATWGLGPALSLVYVGAFMLSPLVLHSSLLGLQIGSPLTIGDILGVLAGAVAGTIISVITCLAVKRRQEVIATKAELAANTARVSALFEQSSDLMAVLDASGKVLYASPSTERILGYPPEEAIGLDVFTEIHPDDLASAHERWERIVQATGQRGELVQARFRHADGTWRVMESITNNRLNDPQVRGMIVNSRDITERVQAQEVLRASEQRFRTVVQEAPVGIMILNADGIFEAVNPTLCAISGYEEGELIGQPFTIVVPPEQRAALAQRYAERFAQGVRVEDEYEVRAKDGRLLTILSAGVRLTDLTGQPKRASFIIDITDRKRAEQEQTLAAEAMAEVSVALGSTLELADLYAVILQQAGKVLPLDHAQILAPDDGWMAVVAHFGEPSVPPGTRLFPVSQAIRHWERLRKGLPLLIADTGDDPDWRDVPPWLGPYRRRSLLSIPLLVEGELLGLFEVASLTPHTYGDRHMQIAIVIGDRITQALRNVRLFDAEQQRARAAEELMQLRSDFVASVSHELRTPLTAMVGLADLLLEHWARLPEEHKRDQINRIRLAARRQYRLVEDLLLLSNLESGPPTLHARPVLLAPLVQNAVGELQGSYAGQQVDLKGPVDLQVRADPDRLLQIMTNLLDNAAKYSAEGTPIFMTWSVEDDMVVVRVRDYGPGIVEEEQERLFTRFGRVAGSPIRAGRIGTGLGLYLSRQLAQAMGGDLDLEATGPDGSTFRLQLPIYPAEQATDHDSIV
jgi:PAS domain S-box-containing protein